MGTLNLVAAYMALQIFFQTKQGMVNCGYVLITGPLMHQFLAIAQNQ